MKRVLVTGASGFVGSALLTRFGQEPAIEVIAGVRRPAGPMAVAGARCLQLGNLEEGRFEVLQQQDISVVVHAAARVHVMRDRASDPLAEFRRVNVAGTLALARAAAAAGVRRFLFISSIKVNGEASRPGVPFRADDSPAPSDPYGISKHEAEQGLLQIARETGMEVVIVRPPLVHGPGVGANFLSMLNWLDRGLPLPLGGIDNRRSLVALDNLVDLLHCCIEHPAAANQVFLVCDGEDLSTSELLRCLGEAMGRPARLLPWASAVRRLLRVVGREALIQRLYGSLQVDMSKTRQMLGWNPPLSARQALRQTAAGFLRSKAC